MRMTTPILLLTDYRNYFYSSTRAWDECMRVDRICDALGDAGFAVTVRQFADLDFGSECFEGRHILYQSTEDPGLLYKGYLTDVLLGLAMAGANLIPRFSLFHAHHNKVFMEILREVAGLDAIRTLRWKHFGTLEEFAARVGELSGPLVMKPAEGALSAGVVRVETKQERLDAARRISRSGGWYDLAKDVVKRRVRERRHLKSSHRRKFIVQEFVPSLVHDYKVLVYGEKYYVLTRRNRKGDFRASGSGLFAWPDQPPDDLLDYARRIFEHFDCPFVALDIAHDGRRYHLLEMQFVSFGNLTLEQSPFHFTPTSAGWRQVQEVPDLEREFASAVAGYLRRHLEGGQPFRQW